MAYSAWLKNNKELNYLFITSVYTKIIIDGMSGGKRGAY